jgi:hypothetical protein
MRFRPANIRLINRRYYLPRLLLALSSNSDKSKDNNKNHPIDVPRLTGHSISGNIRIVQGGHFLTKMPLRKCGFALQRCRA